MEGAEAFAAFFIDSLNSAARMADPGLLEGLYTRDCTTCIAMHESIQTLRTQQRRHAAATLIVRRSAALSFTDDQKTVQLDVDQRAVQILDKTGRGIDTTRAGSGAFVMTLEFGNGHWVASRLQTVAS
jgi:hypothetical protein